MKKVIKNFFKKLFSKLEVKILFKSMLNNMNKISLSLEILSFANSFLCFEETCNDIDLSKINFLDELIWLKKKVQFKKLPKNRYKFQHPDFNKKNKPKEKEIANEIVNKITNILEKTSSNKAFNDLDEALRSMRDSIISSFNDPSMVYEIVDTKTEKSLNREFNDDLTEKVYKLTESRDYNTVIHFFEDNAEEELKFVKEVWNSPNHSLKENSFTTKCNFDPKDLIIRQILRPDLV